MKVTRYGVFNDIHGPYHTPRIVNLLLDIYEDQHVDCLILNGDVFDFANISRHNKRSPLLQPALEDEFDWGNDFFSEIRKRFILKGVKVIYIRGNHEEWLDQYTINNAPAFWNICKLEKMVDLEGVEVHPYNDAIEIERSNLWVQHSPPSYAKTGPYTALKEKADASFLWGCTHRLGHAAITGQSGKVYHGWFNGWCGDIDLTKDQKIAFKYKKGHKTWQHGASIVDVINGERFLVQQFAIERFKKAYVASVAGTLYEG